VGLSTLLISVPEQDISLPSFLHLVKNLSSFWILKKTGSKQLRGFKLIELISANIYKRKTWLNATDYKINGYVDGIHGKNVRSTNETCILIG